MQKKIYFDSNATTMISDNVVKKMMESFSTPSNASAIHQYGRDAKNIIEEVRGKIYKTLNIPKNFRVIFTSSATEGNNIVSHSTSRIVVSATEHPSIMKCNYDYIIPVNKNGEILLDELENFLNKNEDNSKCTVFVMAANNEIGVVNPISDICNLVRKYDAKLHVDAVQAIGKYKFDIGKIDSLVISGHKFGGPQGVGCLIYNTKTVKIFPLMVGGGQEYGMRPGTENFPAIVGLGAALDNIDIRINNMKYVAEIRDYIENQLIDNCEEVIIFGKNAKNRLQNTTSIMMPNVKSEVQIVYFDIYGIAASAGSACSAGRVDNPAVQMAMGYSYEEASCALRISLDHYNTFNEAKFFVEKWLELYRKHKL